MPSSRILVDGAPIGSGHTIKKIELTTFDRSGVAFFHFQRRGPFNVPALPDPFSSKTCEVWIDPIHDTYVSGDIWFRGIIGDGVPQWTPLGYCMDYMAYGMEDSADYFPIVDDTTGQQDAKYNLQRSDPLFRETRSGRSAGQVVLSVLEMGTNSDRLDALGIGNYRGIGKGAVMEAILAGRSVTGVNVTDSGHDYTAGGPDSPTIVFIGSDGTGAAAHVSSVSGGAIVGVATDDGGDDYTSPPQIVVSRLPLITARELLAADLVASHEFRISGDKLWSSICNFLRSAAVNRIPLIQPNGNIRLFDVRTMGQTQASIGTDCRLAAVVVDGEIVGIDIINPGTGHSGSYSVTITDPVGTGANVQVTAHNPTGRIVSYTITDGGQDYTGPKVEFDIEDDMDKPTIRRSTRGCYQRVVINGGLRTEAAELRETRGQIQTHYSHHGLDEVQAMEAWSLPDFTQPTSPQGQAKIHFTIDPSTHFVDDYVIDFPGYAYDPSLTNVPIFFSGGGGGSGAIAHATTDAGGRVDSVVIDNGGGGYTEAPSATVDAPLPGSMDTGIVGIVNATTVLYRSDNIHTTWPADYWGRDFGKRRGNMLLTKDTPGMSVEQVKFAPIATNTDLTPGGESTFTLIDPLPGGDYDRATVSGDSFGASRVYREFYVPGEVGRRMTEFFSPPGYPYATASGLATSLLTSKAAWLLKSFDGGKTFTWAAWNFTIDPDNQLILFEQPIVRRFGTEALLVQGGDAVDGLPDEIIVLLPVLSGANTVACPPDTGSPDEPNYEGTSYTIDGLTRTRYQEMRSWADNFNKLNMKKYACDILDSVKDARYIGDISYNGLLGLARVCGARVSITMSDRFGADVPEMWSEMNVPVVRAMIKWGSEPNEPDRFRTVLSVSNDMSPYAADEYLAPAPGPNPIGGGMGQTFDTRVGQGASTFGGDPSAKAAGWLNSGDMFR